MTRLTRRAFVACAAAALCAPARAADRALPDVRAIAVDRDGNVYAACGGGEAGASFRAWTPDGKPLVEAALPADSGTPCALAVDEDYLYCAVSLPPREPWNERQQVRRFRRKNGEPAAFTGKSEASYLTTPKVGGRPARASTGPSPALLDGHVQLYEWPALMVPKGTPEADAEVMRVPLRAVDVVGTTLYVADALGGRVRMYDTATGDAKGDFAAHLPTGLAVDPLGQIWVALDHGTVRAYRSDGYSGVTYSGLKEVTALAFGPGGKLYAADAKSGQVFTPGAGGGATGEFVAVPVPADRMRALRAVAADNGGNLVTLHRAANGSGGARVAKWSAEGKLLWEQIAKERASER